MFQKNQSNVLCTPNLNRYASTNLGRCARAQTGAPGLRQVRQGSGRCARAQAGAPMLTQLRPGGTQLHPGWMSRYYRNLARQAGVPRGPLACRMRTSSVTKSLAIYDAHPMPLNAHQNQRNILTYVKIFRTSKQEVCTST